jgi:hypothetical protein
MRRTPDEEVHPMKVTPFILGIMSFAALAACGTTTGERTTSGALLGAGTGAALGSLSGDAGKGALIGAGAGALGGFLYDQSRKQAERDYYYDRHHPYKRSYHYQDSYYSPSPFVW